MGLTALLVGGVGVANAVATFIDRRRNVIATMKSLGATSRLVFSIFLVQVLTMAALGVLIGLAVGLTVPVLLTSLYGDVLPIKAELSFSATSIVTGAAYGLLVALLFTLWPLGRAELVSASVLFRDEVAPERVWPRRRIIVLTLLVALSLIAFAVLMAESQRIALYFCLALLLVFAFFSALGMFVNWAARRVPRPRIPELALAIGNLGAPGGLTRSVVLSLGAGLSLLVAVALANASLVQELTGRIPTQSPNYFVLDVPKGEYADVAALVAREAPGAIARRGADAARPSHRAQGQERRRHQASAGGPVGPQWRSRPHLFRHGSRRLEAGRRRMVGEGLRRRAAGVVRAAACPPPWSRHRRHRHRQRARPQHHGAHRQLARGEVGEPGAELRHGVLAEHACRAPRTISWRRSRCRVTQRSKLRPASRASSGRAFPSITVIRVKDALEAFGKVFTKVMLAVQVAGGVTLLAGALVLAGALATAQRRRILEAVILKVLGATRRRILVSHFAEYLMLASATALFAVVLGAIAAYVAVRHVMDIEFNFAWAPVGQALVLALGLVAVFRRLRHLGRAARSVRCPICGPSSNYKALICLVNCA